MALPKFFLGRVSLQQPVPAYSCLSCTTREEKKSWKKAALPGRRTARVGKKLPELEKSNKHIKQKIKRKITKTYKRKIKQQKSTHKQTAASAAPLGRRTPRVGKSEKLFEANTETLSVCEHDYIHSCCENWCTERPPLHLPQLIPYF